MGPRKRRITIDCDLKFSATQIEKCGKCKHASARVAWCGLFGVDIRLAGTIIVPKRKYPSMTKMAGTFAKSTAKHIASGMKNRSAIEQERILKICRACDDYTETATGARCRQCGCNLRIKKRWLTSNCPIGKW